MNNEFFTMDDTKAKKEVLVAENITYYEALTLVWEARAKRDGNFYWIGKPRGKYGLSSVN